MTAPFLIYGLPRSRTFWLSKLLSYRDWHCGHDEIRHMRSLEDVRAWFSQPCTGTVETAAAPFWRLVPDGVRQVVVRRSVADVVASAVQQGFAPEVERLIRRLDAKLDQIERRVPGVLSVSYDDLATAEGCKRVWSHCLPYPWDSGWWAAIAGLNMQASIAEHVRYAVAYGPQIERATAAAKAAMVAKLGRRRRGLEGFTFQQEPWATFYRDGRALFDSHTAVTGRGKHSMANLPMLRMMNQTGALEITTARSNGRLFGYVMSVVAPSMDDADKITAMHATTYASPDVPGLGIRLVRAANEALRARGVSEVMYRVGEEQPKHGALYRRLGAVPDGKVYRLGLH